ncbi:MAG: helix-turn-helix domain-containing protein [Treponemataceae bacterium]|nr:helix-turn-helix domain-containing protein [Treponemataceae bacterium]
MNSCFPYSSLSFSFRKKLRWPGSAARFFFFLFLGNIIGTGITGFLLSTKAPAELEEETIRLQHQLYLQAARSLDTALRQTDLSLQQLSTETDLCKITEYYKGGKIDFILQTNDKLNNFRIVHSHIQSLAIYFPEEQKVFIPNAGYFSFAEQGDPFILHLMDGKTIQTGWYGAHPIEDLRTGNRISVISVVKHLSTGYSNGGPFIVINLDESYLRYLAGIDTTDTNTELLLIDEKGDIFSKLKERGYTQLLKNNPIFQKALTSKEASLIIESGDRYLCTIRNSYLVPWKYVGIIPLPAISKQIRFLRTYSTSVFLFGIGFSICFSFYFSRRLKKLLIDLLYIVSPGKEPQKKDPLDSLEDTLRELRNHSEALEESLQEQLPILRNNILENLLKGRIEEDEHLDKILASYGITFPPKGDFFCIVATIEEDITDDQISRRRDLSTILVLDTLREVIAPMTRHTAAVFTREDEIALIIEANIDEGTKQVLTEKVRETIEKELASPYFFSVRIGVGKVYHHLSDIARSFNEGRTIIRKERNYERESTRISQDSPLETELGYNNNYPFDVEEELILALRRADTKSVEKAHAVLMENLKKDHQHSMAIQLMAALNKLSAERGLVQRIKYQDILAARNFEELDVFFRSWYQKIIEISKNKKDSHNRLVAEKIARYVQNHFHEPLSLYMLSRHVYLSEAYLSRIFHEEMGKPLKQFINEVRSTEAKRLLSETELSITEIANRVGYPNAHGFMKFFKEQTGMSPKEYRYFISQKRGAYE